MTKFNSLQDFSFAENEANKENKENNESNNKIEKVLCNYCGRTKSNGIRCLGICVADSEY